MSGGYEIGTIVAIETLGEVGWQYGKLQEEGERTQKWRDAMTLSATDSVR